MNGLEYDGEEDTTFGMKPCKFIRNEIGDAIREGLYDGATPGEMADTITYGTLILHLAERDRQIQELLKSIKNLECELDSRENELGTYAHDILSLLNKRDTLEKYCSEAVADTTDEYLKKDGLAYLSVGLIRAVMDGES